MSTKTCYNQLEAVSEQLEIFSINWKYFSKSFKAVLVKNMSTETCYEQLEAVSEQLEIFSTYFFVRGSVAEWIERSGRWREDSSH